MQSEEDRDLAELVSDGGAQQKNRRDEMKALTSREREIALLVCTGLSNKQIARRLDVTEGTVKVHLHNIYVKFAIRNRTMLALLALNLGVTAPTIESGVSLAA
jgi:DNA-binding NarL/FixJ family response regulator